jgi:hypothetical protein
MKIFTRPIIRRLLGVLVLVLAHMPVFSAISQAEESSLLGSLPDAAAAFDNQSVKQVQPILQETVPAEREYQGGSFRVLARKSKIQRYKCSSCHTEKKSPVKSGAILTHGNIVINHGKDGNELTCIDCHHPEDRDYLEDKKGRKIDFDHSYQLCGQCHFRQKRDWTGGAHGKRVANWAGERVVYNCATCHNPHSPRFEKRYPATYSVPLK